MSDIKIREEEQSRAIEQSERRSGGLRVRTGCRAGSCYPSVEYDFIPN